jgi:CheY-like chemotaxis protein
MPEPGATVLLVDDNIGFREVVVPVLEEGSPRFVVRAVETGMQAVRHLEQSPPGAGQPAFIVLDFHLPDLNAPRLLARLARLVDLRAVPVLVLSQADWPEDKIAALAAGAAEFQVKPSRVEDLRNVIVSFWGRNVEGG